MKGVEGVGACALLGRKFEPLSMDYRFQVKNGPLKQLINYNEVKFLGLCHLRGSVFKPQLNDRRRVFAAPL